MIFQEDTSCGHTADNHLHETFVKLIRYWVMDFK